MQPIEVTAKKVDDAIREGLRLLGTTLDKVEYKVISSGGLFKKAKISIALIGEDDGKKQTASKEAEKAFDARSESQSKAPQKTQQDGQNYQKNITQGSNSFSTKETPKKAFEQKEQPKKPFEQKESPKKAFEPKEYPRKPFEQKQTREENGEIKANSTSNKRPIREAEPKEGDIKRRVRTEEITDEDIKSATEFATELIGLMGIDAEIKVETINGDLVIDLVSNNSVLIGYRGETLDAIEYLVSIHVNKSNDKYINIIVDCSGYRQKREKMLVSMAEKAASRCIKTGRKVVMEPMNRNSRKVVHSTLSQFDNIITKSEGTEPNRHIVIFFKRERRA